MENSPKISKWMFWKKRRHVMALMIWFGFLNIYALRVNLSIAIVAMTENKTIFLENGTTAYEREFDWDSKLQGFILSSFFYGYITTQLLGGWLASRIGGKKVFGAGIAVTAALTILTPWLARTNVYLFLILRIVEGVFEGVTYPCVHAIWAQWAPPLERSRLATFGFSGGFAGTVVAMPLSAYIATSLGWPSIFYVFGALGVVWSLVWFLVVAESPSVDRYISSEERNYIQDSLGTIQNQDKIKHPWKSMFTSIPVWAIVISHFSETWGFFTLLTQLPKFMKDVLNYDLGKAGYMSALPYLTLAITMPISGFFADLVQEKNILSTTHVRKLFTCGAFLAQTIFMMGAAFWLSPMGTSFCLTLAVGLGGFAYSGFSINPLDVAPQHASVLMGLGNTFGAIPGIVSPIITGYIVTTPNQDEWRIIFYISSSIYLFGAIIYGIFASGQLQPWAIKTTKSIHVEDTDSKSKSSNK